jgi:hypothetical protein
VILKTSGHGMRQYIDVAGGKDQAKTIGGKDLLAVVG